MMKMIFESPDNRYPTIEKLVQCNLFRNVKLYGLQGPSNAVRTYALLFVGKTLSTYLFLIASQVRCKYIQIRNCKCGSPETRILKPLTE